MSASRQAFSRGRAALRGQAVPVRRVGARRLLGPLMVAVMVIGVIAILAAVWVTRPVGDEDAAARAFDSLGADPPAADPPGGGPLTPPIRAAISSPVASPAASPTPTPRRPIVALDVGHGGPDDDLPRHDPRGRVIPWYREGDNSGAIHRSADGTELREKDLTLRLALAAAEHLEARDIKVVLTRRDDVPVNLDARDYNGDGKVNLADELLARVAAVNRSGADVLVSIHINANPSPYMRGTFTNYATGRPFTEQSIRLAVTVHEQVFARLKELNDEVVNRGVEDDIGDDPEGRHLILLGGRTARQPLETTMPGVLIEALFLTNSEDVELLQRDDVLDAIALGIAEGIIEFLGL